MENELMSLPMVALRGLAVLPEQVTHFDVSREKSVHEKRSENISCNAEGS